MTDRKRWTGLAAQGFVIVASILLAFSIDAGWDNLQERDEERRIIESLRSEFEAKQAPLDSTVAVHTRVLDRWARTRKMGSLKADCGVFLPAARGSTVLAGAVVLQARPSSLRRTEFGVSSNGSALLLRRS